MEREARLARICGAIYLVVVATGIFSLAYVPSQTIVADDPVATLSSIRQNEALYRLGIAGLLVNQLAFFLLPLALYELLAPVDRNVARVMILSGVLGIPFALIGGAERMVLLDLLNASLPMSQEAVAQLASVSRMRAGRAMMFAWTFWGLWLLPFGYLVYRSGFLPRFLGVLLMMGCGGYLFNLFGHVLVADHGATTLASVARLPATVGEIGTCLWLLVFGARPRVPES